MRLLDSTAFARSGRDLAARDPDLASIVSDHGFPDFWHRPAGFATLALLIVEQQVSLASAKAVFERLVTALGRMDPAVVVAADGEIMTGCGLTRQKQRYLRELATAVVTGDLDLAGLSSLDDSSARTALLAQVGIGPWTADVYLLSSLRRPDIWPIGDRALQVGIGERLGMEAPPSPADLAEIGERWRPFRSVAARLIWHDYLKRRGRSETTVAGLGTGIPDTAHRAD
jgi:DNA-3-methyladenine glycosylase II